MKNLLHCWHGKKRFVTIIVSPPKDAVQEISRIKKYVDSIFENLSKNYKFVGKSICEPEDNFDEDFGKKLSTTRAYKKKHEKTLNKLCRLHNYLYEFLTPLDILIKKYEAKLWMAEDMEAQLLEDESRAKDRDI